MSCELSALAKFLIAIGSGFSIWAVLATISAFWRAGKGHNGEVD